MAKPRGRNTQEMLGEIRSSFQARESLSVLEWSNGTTNDDLLCTWLGKVGLGIAHRDLTLLLDRFEREGLVKTHEVEGRRVIKITRDGLEVAQNIYRKDWIAPPR